MTIKYQKILSPILLVAIGLYIHFAHNNYGFINSRPKILGTATSSDTSVLLDQISTEFQNLQDKNATLQTSLDKADFLLAFPRTLKRGMTGTDVTALQTGLNQLTGPGAQIPVSGHFAKITEMALKEFQKKQGLKATGIFDQTTKEKLAESIISDIAPDQIDIIPSLQALIDSQKFAINDNASTTTLLSDSSSDGVCPVGCISQDEIPACPDQSTPTSPNTSLPAVTTNSATSTSLSISNILSSGVSASGASITWNTNVNSDSQVDYGKTTSYGQSTPLNSTLVASHSVVLTSLTDSTRYHFKVKSKDASGNLATSADQTFITLAPPDIIPPKISNIKVINITSSAATITWTTDENSDSQVVYDKTNSYGLSTPLDASLVTSHSVNLTGLTASTQYHFQVKSKDGSGNLATSGDQTFSTTK